MCHRSQPRKFIPIAGIEKNVGMLRLRPSSASLHSGSAEHDSLPSCDIIPTAPFSPGCEMSKSGARTTLKYFLQALSKLLFLVGGCFFLFGGCAIHEFWNVERVLAEVLGLGLAAALFFSGYIWQRVQSKTSIGRKRTKKPLKKDLNVIPAGSKRGTVFFIYNIAYVGLIDHCRTFLPLAAHRWHGEIQVISGNGSRPGIERGRDGHRRCAPREP